MLTLQSKDGVEFRLPDEELKDRYVTDLSAIAPRNYAVELIQKFPWLEKYMVGTAQIKQQLDKSDKTLAQFAKDKTITSISARPLITYIGFSDGTYVSVAWDGERLNWMGMKDGIVEPLE